jgi:TRAP transporter TAXI family solute receptor
MKVNLPKVHVAPPAPMVSTLSETFGFSKAVASAIAMFIIALCILTVVWFVRSAPPSTLTLSSGGPGSSYLRYAYAYRKILWDKYGVDLHVITSAGSKDNLHRLQSSQWDVDIGFVQGGIAGNQNLDGLVSLGSLAYQPLMIFYRSPAPINHLSELAGKRIGVGAQGSGTNVLALTLLQANGITGAPTTLVDVDADTAANGLTGGKLDAIFLMGDSASSQIMRKLFRSTDVQLYSFTQADVYVRKFDYLNKIFLPEGSADLAKDLPAHDIILIGPTVELVARKGLHSAMSDLLIEVAQEVHGKATAIQRRGEFPAPLEHEFKISDDALRYYKSGKSFTYKYVGSFWLANLINRIAVYFLPLVFVLIPALRFFPNAYKFRIRLRFYHFYRRLIRLEREAWVAQTRDPDLLKRLDEIEEAVNRLKVPASLADQYYALRGYINFVRGRLNTPATAMKTG